MDELSKETQIKKKVQAVISGAHSLNERVLQAHKAYLLQQKQAHERFLEYRKTSLESLYAVISEQASKIGPSQQRPAASPRKKRTFPKQEVEKSFEHTDLIKHSQGKLAEVFGPEYVSAETYEKLAALPSVPYLLVDKVLSLRGVPGSLGVGCIKTETLVKPDAWYSHENRMPGGIQLEAAQGLLFLLSFLGIDFVCKGEKFYRLLGCELNFHQPMPKAGDTLRFHIEIDGHTQQDGIRIVDFHYDCFANDKLALSVRKGQAGFFSPDDFGSSHEINWSPEDHKPCPEPKIEHPLKWSALREFGRQQLKAFSQGRTLECFGPGFERTLSQHYSPRIAAKKMCLLDEVLSCEPTGGPWKRGYLKAKFQINSEAWFLKEYFRNDPHMPGGLIYEGCIQALAFYLTYIGFTINRDAWRFEPCQEEAVSLSWGAYAPRASQVLEYEVFVEELFAKPLPRIRAYILCKVDGKSCFLAKKISLQMVPDYEILELTQAEDLDEQTPQSFPFDRMSLLACAVGEPAKAYPVYQDYPFYQRIPRLPAPPYLFCTLVRSFIGEWGHIQLGAEVEMEYHFQASDWYFSGEQKMPFCVLVEIALQTCTWLSSALGSALGSDQELFFRNLNGKAVLNKEIKPSDGTVITNARLIQTFTADAQQVQCFEVDCSIEGEGQFFHTSLELGIMSLEDLANKTGLASKPEEFACLLAARNVQIDLSQSQDKYWKGPLCLQQEPLLMLDRITCLDLHGGNKGLGSVIAEKSIKADDWFFKAHFFNDPVMPTSLCLESGIQMLRVLCIESGYGQAADAAEWEVVSLGRECQWHCRGQITPETKMLSFSLSVEELQIEPEQLLITASVSIWADEYKVCEIPAVGLRIKTKGPVMAENFNPKLPITRHFDSESRLSEEFVRQIDANPYTARKIFGSYNAKEVLFKEYVAHLEGVHPAKVPGSFPFNEYPVKLTSEEDDLVLTPQARSHLQPESCLAFWQKTWGLHDWLGSDLMAGLLRRFVHSVYIDEPDALLELKNKPIVFISNQQVGIENLLFSQLIGSYLQKQTVSVLRQEHQRLWIDDLIRFYSSYPAINMPEQRLILPRAKPRGLDSEASIYEPIIAKLLAGDALILPAISIQASFRSQPAPMSNAIKFLLANLEAEEFYLVPVRFFGALPARQIDKILDFPYAMSKQKILLGKPIPSDELRTCPIKHKMQFLYDAIIGLDNQGDQEELLAADEDFGRVVHTWMLSAQVKVEQAVLFCTLREMVEKGMNVSLQTQRLVEAQSRGELLALDDRNIHSWLERLTRWLLGRKFFT